MNFLKNLLQTIFEYIFRCRHNHLTRPFTLKQRSYLVCLDCGYELHYQPSTLILKDPEPSIQEPLSAVTQKLPTMPFLLRKQKKRRNVPSMQRKNIA